MSISFWVNSASASKTCQHFECMCRRDGEIYDRCVVCKGTGVYTTSESDGEFNMSNANAPSLFAELQIEFDHAGSFPLDQMWKLHDRCNERIYQARNDGDEYIERRLQQFRELTLKAIHFKSEICWG